MSLSADASPKKSPKHSPKRSSKLSERLSQKLSKKLEHITPVVVTGDDLENNKHLSKPGNIIIHVPDTSSSGGKTLDEEDRQKQIDIENKYKKRRLQRGKRYWARRILVGKDDHEEALEKKDKKKTFLIKKEIRRHLAEFIGSFYLVFLIAGIQINQNVLPGNGVTNIDKGILSGLLLSGLIYSFGGISGAHFNPCITLAFTLRGSFNVFRAISYITVQFVGAVASAAALQNLFGNVTGLGTTFPVAGFDIKKALGLEILLTFLLVTVVLTTAVNAQILGPTSGLAVGSTFGALEIFGWNFSGASLNPWRTLGPTLISGFAWSTYWIYIVGPLVGTFFAVVIQRMMVSGTRRESLIGAGEGKIGSIPIV